MQARQEILATTMEIFPHRVPMFMELMQAGTLSLPISLCLGKTCVGVVIAGDFAISVQKFAHGETFVNDISKLSALAANK